jgi:RNA polymerase sigma-70 factor (ECF subfamily)
MPRQPVFVTTHWSLVLSARDPQSPRSAEALEKLCRAYWYPLYAYVRRTGQSRENAEDLTQAFFARLLEKNYLEAAEPERGRFRSFLLMALKRFMANEWHKAHAQKREGSRRHLPLPLDTAETRYAREPVNTATPEQAFEKQWALTLLETVLSQLRTDYEQDGKGRLFEALKPCLLGSRELQPYAELAAALKMSEGAVKVAVHRLRERYRERLKAEIANTVASPADVAAELRHLFRVLGRTG